MIITILGYLICAKAEIKCLAPFLGPLIFMISTANTYFETYDFFDQSTITQTKDEIRAKRDLTIHYSVMTLVCWLILSQEWKVTSLFYGLTFALNQFAMEVCICVLLTAPMTNTIKSSFNHM